MFARHSTVKPNCLCGIRSLLPRGVAVLLVGDTEFGSIPYFNKLDQWRWHYVLRQKDLLRTLFGPANRLE
jgi:hypothetical protein